jgi:CheY-like chemotaxis protein
VNVIARRFVVATGLALLGLGIAVGGRFVAPRPAIATFLLVLCGLASLALVRTIAAAAPRAGDSLFERALVPPAETSERPPALTRIEVDLAFGVESAAQLHSRVVPTLRAIARARLASEHGVDLERSPEAASALVREEAWELVRPDREPPEDLLARGLPLGRIAAAVGYDVILCDMRMPWLRGADFYAAVAAIDAELASRIVFMSAAPRRERDARSRRYLEKPLSMRELRAAIARVVRERV